MRTGPARPSGQLHPQSVGHPSAVPSLGHALISEPRRWITSELQTNRELLHLSTQARKPVTIAELEGRTTDSSRRLALRASTIYGSSRFLPPWKTQSLFRHGSSISGTDPARSRIG